MIFIEGTGAEWLPAPAKPLLPDRRGGLARKSISGGPERS